MPESHWYLHDVAKAAVMLGDLREVGEALFIDIAMLLPRPNMTQRWHWTVELVSITYQFEKYGPSGLEGYWWGIPGRITGRRNLQPSGARVFFASSGEIILYSYKRAKGSGSDITEQYQREGLTPRVQLTKEEDDG